MRHRKSGRQLNRNSSHRQAMFRNMAGSLVRHEIIKTTLPKAKELRRVVEPLITLAKTDSVANRRLAFARTRDNEIVAKLFNELGPRFASRAGGYTRILKCGFRAGDNAPMAYIELVDRAEPSRSCCRVICSNVKNPPRRVFLYLPHPHFTTLSVLFLFIPGAVECGYWISGRNAISSMPKLKVSSITYPAAANR